MDKEGKNLGKKVKEQLSFDQRLVWDRLSAAEREEVFKFAEDYKKFLDAGKTERESVREIVRHAEEAGFVALEELLAKGKKIRPGTRVYTQSREKNVALAVIGREPLWHGINIIGAHVDSPRLDLKPNPLYEEHNLALMKTHYYGGIKKYQWLAVPLAMHGVVIRENGEKLPVVIGEALTDPVFAISDLLPHLAREQMEKKLSEAFPGEGLNIIVGGLPLEDKEAKDRIKLAVLDSLNKKYGIVEEDFISAELELVPAGPARDIGFDRSLLGGYGQDDRVCAYTSLRAVLGLNNPARTAIALFVDKEETGSTGNTGMRSRFFENIIAELLYLAAGDYNEIYCRRALANSSALSADVSTAMDPNFEGVLDKYNAARMGAGVVITKYTGSGGKSSTSDANAEFVAAVRQVFNRHKIVWQSGELGKVDGGGGGTIAQFIARYGMDVLDCGVALLAMHSPMEIAHKADIYMGFKAYQAFYEGMIISPV